MAGGTGISNTRIGPTMFFGKIITITGPSGGRVAGAARPDGLLRPLILQGLVVVREHTSRDHGMRARMATGAVNTAMPGGIPVESGTGIDLGHA